MSIKAFDDGISTTLVVAAVYPLGPAALILMPMIIGGVIDSYNFSEQQAAMLGSLEGAGIVVASIAAAFWIRRISWRRVLLWGFLLTAMLNVVSANVSEFGPLAITRCLAGITGGTIFSITVAALGDNRRPDRAFGIAQVVQGILMFGAFVLSPVISEIWGIGGVFYMLAAASLVMTLTLGKFPGRGVERLVTRQEPGGERRNQILIWLGLLASVFFFIGVFGFWAFIERIGLGTGISSATIGLALGGSQIAGVGGALIATIASDRFGRTMPILVVMIGQIAILWILLDGFGSTTFFVGAGLFQTLFMLGISYQMGAIAKIDVNGKFLVLMTAAQGVGSAFGPSIAAGLIRENSDYSAIYWMAMVCFLLSGLIFVYIIKCSRNIGLDANRIRQADPLPKM